MDDLQPRREDPTLALRERSALRLAQIERLVRKLSDAAVLHTVDSRARCRALATKVIQLMDEEDEYRRFLASGLTRTTIDGPIYTRRS